jgi:hypothetical protein
MCWHLFLLYRWSLWLAACQERTEKVSLFVDYFECRLTVVWCNLRADEKNYDSCKERLTDVCDAANAGHATSEAEPG